MAFAVLPYPSIDFVPLDVLTADELDELVANINAVNNGTVPDGAITTAKVVDGAITASKIDWDSMESGTPVSLGYSTSGGSFTATHFGYVVVECAVQNNAYISITVNSAETLKAQGGATSFEWIPVVIPVCKGDVIVATSSDSGNNAQVVGANSKFIPMH